MFEAIIISRLKDKVRRDKIENTVPEFLNWQFLDATDGHHPENIPKKYRALSPDHFWGGKEIKPGAFGCFASHYRAWLLCAEMGKTCVILEDDVIFNENFSDKDLEELVLLSEKNELDLVMANKRAVDWVQLYVGLKQVPPSLLYPIRDAIKYVVDSNTVPPKPQAPGGDCYILTPSGAKKLAELADARRVICGVDWFILGCALAGIELNGEWRQPKRAVQYFDSENPLLDISVSHNWFTKTINNQVGGSVLVHTNKVDIDDFFDSFNGELD